jgi:hypothetical protein
MHQRYQRQKILGVLLRHNPQHAGLVRGWVTEHAEGALDQVSEAALLAALALGCEVIDRETRRVAAKRQVDQFCTVLTDASSTA